MKRVLKRIGQAILLAILVLVALIYAPVWDTAPPDVADLAVVRAEERDGDRHAVTQRLEARLDEAGRLGETV